MQKNAQIQNFDLTVDKLNLYREESITDFKVASIRKMAPINPDGSDDNSRQTVFIGQTQLMSEEGPLPVQAEIDATNLEEAIDKFPDAMKIAIFEMMEELEKWQKEQQAHQKSEESRIIVPKM